MKLFFFLYTFGLVQTIFGVEIKQGFKWNKILYEGDTSENFNPDNNILTAFAYDPESQKLFLTVPRKYPETMYTLAEVDTEKNSFESGDTSPLLGKFSGHETGKELTSVYQPVIDECHRLWVVDVGSVERNSDGTEGQPEHNPTLVAYDLKEANYPEVIRYTFPDNSIEKPTFLGGFAVDVVKPDECSETFVYITNFLTNALIVYDHKNKDSWTVQDSTFGPDKKSKFDHDGQQYEYEAGIFGITLGERDNEGNRQAYYLVASSTKLHSINTKELKQKGSKVNANYLGDRGESTDAIGLVYDPKTKTIFFVESNSKRVSCWNTQETLNKDKIDVIYHNADFSFGTDISIDSQDNLWFLANGLPPLENSDKFVFTKPRYQIFKVNIQEAIAGTKCEKNL
ncbi:L-dopachrome tautomerase yellow-f2-like [Lutzomyia longipalpis]|uniref:Yellow-related salivary protein LJM111 n=1 Tax=Lutzomyia longipalpis TaxID=7200 RepID=YP111_LUTLO|nr:L-dopachrome tautomerase yellow-f2-like [Lutzomyia longipalpis]ABB00904.1 43 kDa salivary protein [Lutzomyia longipalpis]